MVPLGFMEDLLHCLGLVFFFIVNCFHSGLCRMWCECKM